MIRHETLNPPQHIYPIHPWKIIETSFYPRFLAQTETLFSVGNGYLGMRGNFEEGGPVDQSGTFINGFHETWPLVYSEKAYGFAKTGQTMLNVTDGKVLRLYVDEEPFNLSDAFLQLYCRTLDMQSGTLDRELLWETPSGKRVLIETRRMVSFEHCHLAVISYQVTLLNAEASVVISSELIGNRQNQAGVEDPRQARGFQAQVLEPQLWYAKERRLAMSHRTLGSGMGLACCADHIVETDCAFSWHSECREDYGKLVLSVEARPKVPIRLVKFLAYHTAASSPARELCDRAEWTLDQAMRKGLNTLLEEQRRFMADFWRRSDLELEGDPEATSRPLGEIQQAMRWNLFQILQAAARAERTGIPAKGLTGQTYEGHYFWDTEIYVLPFLTYTAPHIARNLLRFRHGMLEQARERARQLNQKGALFPWRTVNGEEASAYYAAGTAQYHINADIIYALRKYVEITDDKALLFNEGAEMLVETARLWADLGFFSQRHGGQFCIDGVTGPDEYNTVVNNNAFTNLMAQENLRFAVQTVRLMHENYPEHYETLVHRTHLDIAEVELWEKAAENMYVPFDEKEGIHLQDDGFLDRKPWDLKKIPRSQFPLLLHFHPLVIYRHQVIKQADVVLAMFLLGNRFTMEQKKRNFEYYDPFTTGDSSLSACIQSILATEIGDTERAMKYARYAILMDLADVGGNVKDGCHIASMGGTWMLVVYGFAGMRDYDGQLSFHPRLPRQFKRLRFPLHYRGKLLEVEITREATVYELREGAELSLVHGEEPLVVRKGEAVRRENP